jgi:hypothetical protein
VPGRHLYIKQSRRGQARLEPNWAVEMRPSELSLDELLGKEHPFEVWVAYFDSLEVTDNGILISRVGSPESWEDVDSPDLASLSKAYDSFKTPKKIKLGGDAIGVRQLVALSLQTTPFDLF